VSPFHASWVLVLAAALAGCGGGESVTSTTSTSGAGGSTGSGGAGGGGAGGGETYALHVKIALEDDGQGVALFAQNGSMVHVPKADIVGKPFIWATTPGGEPVGNTKPMDFAVGKMADDLTADFTTPKHYANGPWEMAVVIYVVGTDPTKGPTPGDLAGFDVTDPPKGDPPVTGVSIRMKVQDMDASITLDNKYFIRF
jgi:hypothetical protein